MIGPRRQSFNDRYSPARYARFLELTTQWSGGEVAFRQSETPCFFPRSLANRLADAGARLIEQLVYDPTYRALSAAAVPAEWRVPRETRSPLFVQADFGLVRDGSGEVHPKLVESQGFPSLYAYQLILARAYREAFDLDPALGNLLGGLDEDAYVRLLREAIVGEHDPENVVLVDLDPAGQKTACDFRVTQELLGIQPVCITALKKEGRRLHYSRDGVWTPVHRIYNRAIPDELERRNAVLQFHFNDDLDVEWAPHPNWYFRISKFSIPHLRHESVPRTVFLNQIAAIPDDLENWVLKPLYSFAGLGVIVGPTRKDVDSIPLSQREHFILQERVNFVPVIETPHGPTKVEVRVMYVWNEELVPCNLILRMGRGQMMGVDHNKNMEWVGASAAFLED